MIRYILLFLVSISAACASDFSKASADIFFGIYSNYISSVKHHASQCQFIPSCSQYASDCIEEHGFAKGSILASDRWMRCSGGHANKYKYPKLGRFFYDPVSKNYLVGDGHLWSAGLNLNSGGIRKSKEKPISFIHSLFRENDYQSAILEIKRKKYATSDKDSSQYFDLLISLCNFRQGKPQSSLNTYAPKYSFGIDSYQKMQFYYNYLLHDQLFADNWNLNYLESYSSDLIDKEIQAKMLIYTKLKLGYEAEQLDNKYMPFDTIKYFVDKLEDTPKSPTLAGIMSTILPGAGYFYCGEYKEGASSLMVNGLLAWGIYSLFDNNNTGSGILMSSVGAIFYVGNIVGSINSAEIQNDRYTQLQLLEIRKSLRIEFVFEVSLLEDMIKLIK